MNVQIIQTYGSMAEHHGGPPRTIVALSEALAAREGLLVDLITGTRPDDGVRLLPDLAAVSSWQVPARRRAGVHVYDFGSALDAARQARGVPEAIVHDNGVWAPPNIAVAAAARKRRLPYVISPHGMLQPVALTYHSGRKRIAWQVYQRRILADSAGLLATAEPELAAIRALFPRIPVAIIPNGVKVPQTLLPRRPDTGLRVLYMSRIHPTKNLLGLIDAWATICADPAFGSWTLDIAGPEERNHLAEVTARVAAAGITGRVRFLGQVAESDKALAFASADLFILPSFTENFGIVVSEALAHGLPVITTTGAPWSGLREQRCGWWVAPDAAALAGALQEALVLPPAARAEMGARGRDWVARTLGWERIAASTAAFYDWTLHGGSRPDFVDQ